MAFSNLTRREILVGMISGAVLYPVGLWLVMYRIESKIMCYTLGVMVCFSLQLISFHVVYGYEWRKRNREIQENIARWEREAQKRFDEQEIYKD